MAEIQTHPYRVINPKGVEILKAAPGCEYPPETELYMLLANHRIINNGVEVTMDDVERRIGDPETVAEIKERSSMFG